MFAPVLVLVVCLYHHCLIIRIVDAVSLHGGPTVGTLKSGRLIQKHMPHLKNENYKQLVMLVKQ